jgi:hypothetical protein
MAKARRVNVEGSPFGLRRAKGSVKSKETFSAIEGKRLQNRRKASVESKRSISESEGVQWETK